MRVIESDAVYTGTSESPREHLRRAASPPIKFEMSGAPAGAVDCARRRVLETHRAKPLQV